MSPSRITLQTWQEMPLHELICGKLQNGAFVQKPEKGRGLLFANVVNMYGGIHLDYDSLERLNVAESDIEQYKLNEGDILVVRSSLKREGIGQSCIASNLQETVFYDCHLIRVVPDQSKILPEFLSFYWRSSAGKQDLINRSKTTTMTTINQAGLSGAIVPLPPIPEQKKIADILLTVQRAIEVQERIIRTTTELKKALMHKFFTEGLRNEPQKQTEIGLVPESWEVVPLLDVCRFQSGGTPSKKNPKFWEGTIPWVSPKDMKRPRLDDVTDHISQEALESGSKLAPAGSVFVVVRGMILAKTVPVALAEVPMAINQDMKAIIPGSKLRSDFLLYALETLRGNLFKKVGRSGHGTATLMSHEISAFKIPLPNLETQEEVAAAIQSIERKKEFHEQKRTNLQDLFRTLLHELMTAKTRVHNLVILTEGRPA